MSRGGHALTREGKCEITLRYRFVRQLEPIEVYHIREPFSNAITARREFNRKCSDYTLNLNTYD